MKQAVSVTEAGGLDAEAVARRLRVTVETVYRLVNAGELPASRWPLRVDPADL